MRPVTLPPRPAGNDVQQQIGWLTACVITIAGATLEEHAAIFDSYAPDQNGIAPTTRQVNVTAPTTQNLANALATLIADFQARGVNRIEPT